MVRTVHNHAHVQVGRMELTCHGLHVAHFPEVETAQLNRETEARPGSRRADRLLGPGSSANSTLEGHLKLDVPVSDIFRHWV